MPDPILEVTVLDVGHGNCAIIRDGSQCAIVDAGRKHGTVLDELERFECVRIEHLIISHADADHVGGAATLLLDTARTIGTVWFNSDSSKGVVWERFLRAAYTRHRRGGLDEKRDIHTALAHPLTCGRAQLQVRHPDLVLTGIGTSGRSADLGTLDVNTLSVVVRVALCGEPAVLLAADMDNAALKQVKISGLDISAPVLVFPHHGGLPGQADPVNFTKTLMEMANPKLVIFSQGGRQHSNPRPEIVAQINAAQVRPHIACTQMSVHCHDTSRLPSEHLALRPAAGRSMGRCCAGTITITWTADGLVLDPPIDRHHRFISDHVLKPLCTSAGSAIPKARVSGDS